METKLLSIVAATALALAFNVFPVFAGSLEPSAAPAPTMRTLEQLKPSWDKIIPAAQRFVDALDGTAVLDKETGLVWAKSPDSQRRTWQSAMDYCTTLYLGGRLGWRVPTIEELGTLTDRSHTGTPRLPLGHPFTNITLGFYWSSSTYDTVNAWGVNMDFGLGSYLLKTGSYFVWPVRAGQ
ncbi:MAG: DUF1566 domain-containing protein [Desulfuromonadaceae bacterium]|nr:DUF1566 domain-containing protein [Desulfuromonadaceae bacterium]